VAPKINAFNPAEFWIPEILLSTFDRETVLSGLSFENVSQHALAPGAAQAFAGPALRRFANIPDVVFFCALPRGSPLEHETLKMQPYEGGLLYAAVSGSRGARIIPVEYIKTETVGARNRIMIANGSESFAPGDSGSPLFEVATDGSQKIVGILHGVGANSALAFFTEVASIFDPAVPVQEFDFDDLLKATNFERSAFPTDVAQHKGCKEL
jgi:hypothetical protein